MRVIGRSKSGQIVGHFGRLRPRSGVLLAQRFDAGLRLIEQTRLVGFREAVAWLYAIGAIQFDCIESEFQPVEVEMSFNPTTCDLEATCMAST